MMQSFYCHVHIQTIHTMAVTPVQSLKFLCFCRRWVLQCGGVWGLRRADRGWSAVIGLRDRRGAINHAHPRWALTLTHNNNINTVVNIFQHKYDINKINNTATHYFRSLSNYTTPLTMSQIHQCCWQNTAVVYTHLKCTKGLTIIMHRSENAFVIHVHDLYKSCNQDKSVNSWRWENVQLARWRVSRQTCWVCDDTRHHWELCSVNAHTSRRQHNLAFLRC